MAAATLPLSPADSTAAEPTVNCSQARFAFRQLETWLTSDEAQHASEAQVEEQLQQRGRELTLRSYATPKNPPRFANPGTGWGLPEELMLYRARP